MSNIIECITNITKKASYEFQLDLKLKDNVLVKHVIIKKI